MVRILLVQTVVKMPPEAPKEIFTVLIFATKPYCTLGCSNWAVKSFNGFIFVVVGSSAKVCSM